jgi:aspartate aminotransferase
MRVATGLLYGESDEQREAALAADNPLTLPWITAALARTEHMLSDLGPASQRTDRSGVPRIGTLVPG